ncbi:hypothetical protein GCM10009851_14360 [Herbiconiux moechotypicola]|uniref:Uncharacterized protein n=1 Tax=Herbiconiux moechotypicola TaxID=637393 RepID=A0ABN3DGS8_9MICO
MQMTKWDAAILDWSSVVRVADVDGDSVGPRRAGWYGERGDCGVADDAELVSELWSSATFAVAGYRHTRSVESGLITAVRAE